MENTNNFVSVSQIDNVNDQYYNLQEPAQVLKATAVPQKDAA